MKVIKEYFLRYIKMEGKQIIINNSTITRAIFREIKDNNSKDSKYMFVEEGLVIQGDVVTYNGVNYMVTLKNENINEIYSQYIVTRIKYNNVKFNFQGEVVKVPVLIETGQQGIEKTQSISIIDGKIKLIIQENESNNRIKEDLRFIVMGYVWKVIAKTKEDEGLVYIYAEKDIFNTQYDDKENEIADRWRYETNHKYDMTVEPMAVLLNEGDTTQLNVTVTDTVNNITTPIENPTIIYSSSDEAIATVNETGLVTGILEGINTITVTFIGDGVELSKDINVTIVKEEITHTYSISGGDSITWTVTATYKVLDENGQTATDKFLFNISYGTNPTNLATLTVVDDQTCKIQANSNQLKGDIVLQATSLSTYAVIEKVINIKGFY